MAIVCLDLEGVLLPEFWQEFSKATKIPELMRTTRDEPDYDKLMKGRLAILEKNKLGINEVKRVVSQMQPLEGAPEFMDWLREKEVEIRIITGSYEDYISPLIKKLGSPAMYANTLEIDSDGRIVGYNLPENRKKVNVINWFKSCGYKTIAIGDSYNDLEMLHAANHGILFRAKQELVAEETPKGLSYAKDYPRLKEIIDSVLKQQKRK